MLEAGRVKTWPLDTDAWTVTFRARLTLFFVGIVAAPLIVGAVMAAQNARTQTVRDADARLQVATVTARAALQREQLFSERALSPADALRAFRAGSAGELDRIRRADGFDYLLVLRSGHVDRSSVDMDPGLPHDPAAIAGGALRPVAAEHRVVILGSPGSVVLGGRVWKPRLPSDLRVRTVFVLEGRPDGSLPGPVPASTVPVAAGDDRVVCLCDGGDNPSGLVLFTPARSAGLSEWLRWPRVGIALAVMLGLVGLAYLLARLLTRPLARLAEEVAAVARGEPDVQPAVEPTAGRELYQVATTLRTVSQELTGSRGELERTRGRLAAAQRLTLIDPLTGVWNRRYLDRALREQVKRHGRFGSTFGLLVIDVDRFKRINDRFGHAVGDAVLTEVAHTIDGSIRSDIDVLARFGGEEFVVVLPETDSSGAVVAAEKIRTLVAESTFESEGVPVPVTVSVGAAACPEDGEGEERVLAAADAAMYRAKAAGRNRTVAAHTQGLNAPG
jgi:diguanylate cyclase (GGDEF)-like protein